MASLQSNSNVTLKGWDHASRMFADNQFRLAPKLDFQYHVAFNINTAALKNSNIVQRYSNEINMLAKSVSLPRFEIAIDDVNQYNRHKKVQYRSTPGDVTVKFYDDNMGLINQVWQNYYSYYYADSNSAKSTGSYDRTATKNSNYISNPYGLDNSSTNPFFNYITIYQMAKQEFVSVKLINPIIKSWDGNTLQWDSSKTHEFTMTLSYEAVAYDTGAVTAGTPEGFGIVHYDNTPSPLFSTPRTNPVALQPSFVQTLNVDAAAPNILNNTIDTINRYQNTQQDITPLISGVTTVSPTKAIGGIPGCSFPVAPSFANSTTAKPINLDALK